MEQHMHIITIYMQDDFNPGCLGSKDAEAVIVQKTIDYVSDIIRMGVWQDLNYLIVLRKYTDVICKSEETYYRSR